MNIEDIYIAMNVYIIKLAHLISISSIIEKRSEYYFNVNKMQ